MPANLTKASEPTAQQAILAAFAHEGLTPHRWSNGAHDRYAAHSHPYHKVLYCVRGSITFRIEDSGEEVELALGDRLDIQPQTAHSALVGPTGAECIAAARG